MRRVVSIALMLYAISAIAQNPGVLSFDDFIRSVRDHHPVMFQTRLLDDKSASYEKKARGGLDPSFGAGLERKSFDDKSYYNRFNAGLTIPTLFGLDFKAGYEVNTGEFLDDSETLPDNGLLSAGIVVPLGSGLMFDERRKLLKETTLIRESNDIKRLQIENKLLFNASKAFLEWLIAHERLKIYEAAVSLAQQRLNLVQGSFQGGDSPAIDTLEAVIQVRIRYQQFEQAVMDFRRAGAQMQNYLWLDGMTPLVLDTSSTPGDLDITNWDEVLDELSLSAENVIANHPDLRSIDVENDRLILERRLLQEGLKPTVDLIFNPLFRTDAGGLFQGYDIDDYKLGVRAYVPVFMRKTKADIELTDIAISENQISRSMVRQGLRISIINTLEQDESLETQLEQIMDAVSDYENLLEAENEKFNIGESSVFLLNSRENQLIQARMKYIELKKFLLANRLSILYESQLIKDRIL